MTFYRIISIILYPFLEIYLFYRVYKKKEDKHRLKERFGQATVKRPEGKVIWIHAVSVGEANSAFILIDELLKFSPDISILFTTTTLTSAQVVNKKLADYEGKVIHQFLPIDSYFCVQDFFEFWKVGAAIFVESEIWPNLVYEAQRRGVLSFLVNARISDKSLKRWQLAKKIGLNIFDYFSVIFVQMQEDAAKFESLTDQKILCYGNLKSEAQLLKINQIELQNLQSQINDRKIWVAASTHKGEEEIILETHKKLKAEFSDLLTVIVPRHPNRAKEIKLLLTNIEFAQRSKKQKIEKATEIYLADSLGELGIFYSLANFAFIGASLSESGGGHNPFEAIQLGCAVISGDQVFNFKEIYQKLYNNKGCVIVKNQEQLIAVVRRFLIDNNLCKDSMQNGKGAIANSQNVAGQVIAKIDEMMMLEA